MLFGLINNRGNLSFAEILFMLVSYAVVIFIMLPIHELAHAYAAHRLGDDTAKWNGRLRFNPLAHLDLYGTIMLLLFGVGYARPVPVNPYNFRNHKRDMALCALAGPASNLLMAVASVALFRAVCFFVTDMAVLGIFWMMLVQIFAGVNIGLAAFNLLPVPPLDGFKIFGSVLPSRWVYTMERYAQQISFILMVLLFTGILDIPLDFIRNIFCSVIGKLFGFHDLFNGYL